ncbi:hypothetical protein D9M70_560860 [compost metagenome]
MPICFSSTILATVLSMSSTSRPSVSSSFSRFGSAPVNFSTSSTSWTKSGWWNWRALTFTAMLSRAVSGCFDQATSCMQADCSAQRPNGRISPVSSASGTNSEGITMPRSGCCQRISASAPTTCPSLLTCGW